MSKRTHKMVHTPARVVGMSRNLKPVRLLQNIGPKPTPAINAPPLPSDSEDDQEPGLKSSPSSSINEPDSSDAERPGRGDIRSTKFTSEKKKPDRTYSRPNKRRRLSHTFDDIEDTSSSTSAGRDFSNSPTRSGGHLQTSTGFVRQNKTKATYGSKKASKPRESIKTKAADNAPRSKLRVPSPVGDSPRKLKSAKFVVPEDNLGLSPSEDTRLKRLKTRHQKASDAGNDVLSSPVAKPSLKVLKAPDSSPNPPSMTSKSKTNPMRAMKRNQPRRKTRQEGPKSESPPPTPAKLVIPPLVSDFTPRETPADKDDDDDDDDSPLSDAASDSSELSPVFGVGNEEEVESAAAASSAVCPWCGAPVDKQALDDFSKGKRLHVRMQAKFCQQHKQRAAMETWESRQYPKVEWVGLEERFKKHRGLLLGIINGKSSHYRTILAGKIELGQARLLKEGDNLNPGYYGPRGLNLMCDYLVGEFGNLLKEKAVNDRVIAGRGSATFIQSVLVAELGVQLIKEDMAVSEKSARRILEESKSLGEMVHGES